MRKQVISLNESFIFTFICDPASAHKIATALVKVTSRGNFDYNDVTEETHPDIFSKSSPMVYFTILCEDVTEAAFMKQVFLKVMNN